MTKEFKIADQLIGRDHPLFIIAEMSGNHHNPSLERALEIVKAAAKTGVHGLNLDLYARHHDA